MQRAFLVGGKSRPCKLGAVTKRFSGPWFGEAIAAVHLSPLQILEWLIGLRSNHAFLTLDWN